MADARSIRRLLQLIAAALAALIAATFPLWTPDHPWPQIPWITAARHLPPWWDWLALVIVAAGGCLQFDPKVRYTAKGAGIQAIGLAAALLVDQHRLQPWAYEYLLVTGILALAPNERGLRCVRWLIVSIYVHSALSKLDAAYFETNGRQLLEGLLHSLRLERAGWDQPGPRFACLAFPIGELCVAAGLAVPRTRRIGLALSILMHLLLIWTLGPFGLRHEPGVLIWNVAFLFQNWLLFGRSRTTADSAVAVGSRLNERRHQQIANRLAVVIAAIAMALPLLEPFGCWDHWPSWAVYSSRPAIVTVLVEDSAVARLPIRLQAQAGSPEPLSTWRPLSLDQWSLRELHCPIYPQERFRIAAALAVAEQAGLDDAVLLRIQSPPDRLIGHRSTVELHGIDAIRRRCTEYSISTRSRD